MPTFLPTSTTQTQGNVSGLSMEAVEETRTDLGASENVGGPVVLRQVSDNAILTHILKGLNSVSGSCDHF